VQKVGETPGEPQSSGNTEMKEVQTPSCNSITLALLFHGNEYCN
jgi:hypothetical protein